MIRSMLRSFVLLVSLIATLVTGVFVGYQYPGLIPGQPTDRDPRIVLRDAFAEVSELVIAEAAVKQTITRELAGYLGGVTVRVDTVGFQRLGVDLRQASVVAVDHDARTLTVELPPAEVLHAGLDHDATLITTHTTGLWPLSLAPSVEGDLVAEALNEAADRLVTAPQGRHHPIDVQARVNDLFAGSRWTAVVASLSDPADRPKSLE